MEAIMDSSSPQRVAMPSTASRSVRATVVLLTLATLKYTKVMAPIMPTDKQIRGMRRMKSSARFPTVWPLSRVQQMHRIHGNPSEFCPELIQSNSSLCEPVLTRTS